MTNTNITNFRQNVFEYIHQAIEFNDVVNISTKEGNAIIMSEEDYQGLIETLYLFNSPKTRDEILIGMSTSLEDCISENEVDL